jgi:nicotinate-nucleotide pyrophosphorylase (carboxylating)
MSFDEQLNHLIGEALKEDVGDGDHSTLSCIPRDATGKAVLKIKEDGILAGMEIAKKIFQYTGREGVFMAFKKDGDPMKSGEKAFEINASIHTILQNERLVLNCMQRMSGIATLTR